MAAMLETPSRIWRRIEAIEDRDMPSLPSLPLFEDSVEEPFSGDGLPQSDGEQDNSDLGSISSPVQSTPTAFHHTITSTIRPTSSTSSTARFANSIASRSAKSSTGQLSSRSMSSRRSQHDSFDISHIPSIRHANAEASSGRFSDDTEDHGSEASVPDVYLPPPDDNEEGHSNSFSLTDALQSLSRPISPPFTTDAYHADGTPKKSYDYSVSLRSEPNVS